MEIIHRAMHWIRQRGVWRATRGKKCREGLWLDQFDARMAKRRSAL